MLCCVSETTQLAALAPSTVAKLMRTHLFSPALQSSDEVEMVDSNLSDTWVEDIWQYIARHFPDRLTEFHNLHVLPSGTGKLMKLQTNSAVIVLNDSVSALPDSIQEVCRAVGVRLVRNMIAPVCGHKAVWGEYILRPDACGVVTALTRLNSTQVVSRFQSVSVEGRREFLEYLANAVANKTAVLSDCHRLLHILPMFQTVDNSGFQPSSFVSLTEVPIVAPTEHIPVCYPERLLDSCTPSVQKLLCELNVKTMTISEALTSLVFPAINSNKYTYEEIFQVMQFTRDRWSQLKSKPFIDHMKNVRFVARRNEDLVVPSELFNAHDSRLTAMFCGEDVFPVGVFSDASYIHVLEQLGLKSQESVTAADVWHIVSKLDAVQCCDADAASDCLQCAAELLSFLEQHCSLLASSVPSCNDSLLNLLNRVRWVPVLRRRPDRYSKLVPFHGENYCSLLAYPSEVLSSEHCFLVGSVKQCLDVSVCHLPRVAAQFAWTREPCADDVIRHLQNVIAVSADMESIDLDCECIVNDIYAHLNDHAYKLSESVHWLNEIAWIVHANGFARIEQVVRRKPFMDLQPYVYVLPPAYQKFEELWKTVGMADSCNLVAVLESIAASHEGQTFSPDDVKRDLQCVVNILDEIAGSEDLQKYRDSLLIPVDTADGSLQMRPIDECTYQQGCGASDLGNDICLVHPLVPTSTTKALNIHNIVSRMIRAEELHLGLTSYGQQPEPLTKRLKNILHDYPDGLAVIKELIQNADDAGAKEVRFLYDERQNSDARDPTKLLDPGMKDLQGPALWIYNDESFTKEDFENLVKISGGTKEHCKDKIGRFGLGFNAVYNLTDVPTLLSGNYVVYLDPHTTYLNEVIRDKSKPGIKLDLSSHRRSLQCFCDQFKPFSGIFGCNLSANAEAVDYPATLFRFPLRTQEQSDCSEICNKYYSREEVMSFLSLFLKSANHLLLFTQNVTTVSVCHLAAHDKPEHMKELYCITKNTEKVFRFPEVDHETNHYAFLQMADSSLKADSGSASKLESSLLLRISVDVSANAGPLLHADSADSHATHWLVSSCMGQQESLQRSLLRSDLISVAGVAAQLENHDGQFTPHSAPSCGSGHKGGIVFCFLPLPFTKTTDLPVHINGFFAVTSSRMHLVEKTENDKVDDRAIWNELLMKDAVKLAYENLLQDMLQLCNTSESLLIWPVHKPVAEAGILSCMTDNLYTDLLEENGPNVCRKNGKYMSLSQCRMLDEDFRESEIADGALQVLTVLAETADFEVIDLPVHLLHSMMQTSASHRLQRLQIRKHEFYSQWFLPNISSVEDTALRDQLVWTGLFDNDISYLLHDFRCIPTLPDGLLKKPCDLVHPQSNLAVLYDEEEGRFPLIGNQCHGKYSQSDIYAKLLSIGMQHDDLSWQELSDRCAKVPQKHELSDKRLEVLIHLMSKKVKQVEHVSDADMEYINRIQKERFLPVCTKPNAFPLPWKGDEREKFTSCVEAYLSGVQRLVCCTYPVIDDYVAFKYEHTQLKRLFGLLDKPISMSTVLYQLDCAVCHVSEHTHNARELQEICEEAYSFLGREITKAECARELRNELFQKKCIFVSSRCMFMQPSDCAKKLPVTSEVLLPYLYGVPSTMYAAHGALLETIGVKECFEAADYMRILLQMHDDLGVPVHSHDLSVALDVINNCLTACSVLPEDIPVYVPNVDGIMCAADTLCFNSCQWITVDDDVMLCHPKIPYEAACKLRIKTVQQEYFMQNSIGIEFGQKEKLVTRIRKILTGYPFGKGILKEMLQNADDAGATELHFINDERQLPTERIFGDSWKHLQGPALCVYDNKPFTQHDIAGIQNLGEGSKSDDPAKTGQYGVGFSSVYHITDVPSLLTFVDNEQVLCCFDPHCRYAPGATLDSPGRMLKNISSLQTKFPDVFLGYDYGQVGDEQGSLFRLPLRNADLAIESEISQKPVTSEVIAGLFAEFKSDMYMSLLFLNSVKRICLMNMDAEGSLTTTYSVTAKLSPDDEERRERFQKLVKETARELKDGKCLLKDVGVHEVTYRLITEDSVGSSDEWIVVQRLGFETPEQIPHSVSSAHVRRDLALLPRAGVAYQTITNREHGSKSSQLFCFLPLAVQLTLPVSINGHFVLDYETRKQLWRGEEDDYKTQWNICLMEKVTAPAYCTLMNMLQQQTSQEHLCTKYFALFPSVVKDGDNYMYKLFVAIYQLLQHMSVLPVRNVDSISEPDKLLWIKPVKDGTVEGFFDDLSLPVGKTMEFFVSFVTSKRATGEEKEKEKENREVVRDVLTRCGFLLFLCPMNIYENFQMAGVPVKKVCPEAVLEFFRSYQRPDTRCRVMKVDVPISDTLFKDMKTICTLLHYCTQTSQYKQLLTECPLLVTSDSFLRAFDTSEVKFEPRFADILPHIPGQFFHKDVFSVLHIKAKSDHYLCKMLTVKKFVTELPSVLPKDEFYGAEKRVAFSQLQSPSVLQTAEKATKWLQHVWAFLQSLADNSAEKTVAVLEPLAEWCVLPASNKSKKQLLPVMYAKCVIPSTGSIFTSQLDTVFNKLGVMRPVFLGHVSDFYLKVVGSIESPDSVIAALEEALDHGTCPVSKLTSYDSDKLLCYFLEHMSSVKQAPNSIPTIQRLPIFCNIYEKLISIKDCCVYVLPAGIPVTDMEAWSTTTGIVFLKNNDEMKEFFAFLGCKHVTDTEVYCAYIFMHFEMLSAHGRCVHLLYVRDKLLPKLNSTSHEVVALLEKLRQLQFIPRTLSGHDCDLATASEFYDDSVELLRVMHPATDFVPEPYRDKYQKWTTFLRECGMIHVVTQEMFLQYAKQVAVLGEGGISKETAAQSDALLKHLFTIGDVHDQQFLQKLRSIKFIVPHCVGSVRENFCPQFGKRNSKRKLQLVAFEGSISSKYADAVWSVQSTIKASIFSRIPNTVNIKWLCSQLKTDRKPQLQNVAQHVQVMCTRMTSEISQKQSDEVCVLSSVLKFIYKLLQEEDLSDAVVAVLSTSPCIIDADKRLLLRPEQIVLRMQEEDEIEPYLISIPLDLGSYSTLFAKLGASQSLTINHYAMVLLNVYEESSPEQLHPNEMKAVLTAMRGFFACLKKEKCVPLTSDLYLLGRDQKMYKASALIFDDMVTRNDITDLDQPYFVTLEKCDIDISVDETCRLLRKLPAVAQPQFLSAAVSEVTDTNHEVVECELVQRLNAKLQSEQFKEAIVRLALHSLTKHVEEDDVDLARNAAGRLKMVQIVGVNQLNTYFIHKGERITENERRNVYAQIENNGNTTNWIVYFSVPDQQNSQETFWYELSDIICDIISDYPKLRSVSVLRCPPNTEHNELDSLHVKQYTRNSTNQETYLPLPGTFVPIVHHHILRPDISLMKAGDYAALEKYDPAENDEPGEPTYVIIQITERINCDTATAPIEAKYIVDIGRGQSQVVSAASLYVFSRRLTCDDGPDDTGFDNRVADYDDVINGVKITLTDAWKMEQSDRNKILKRLILQWHPDCNTGSSDLASRVTHFILSAADHLDHGLSLNDGDTGAAASLSSTTHSCCSRSYPHSYYEYMSQRVREHQRQQKEYEQNYVHNTSHVVKRNKQRFLQTFYSALNPQPGEGRRWLRQAEMDEQAANNDKDAELKAYEWACYKYYQVNLR